MRDTPVSLSERRITERLTEPGAAAPRCAPRYQLCCSAAVLPCCVLPCCSAFPATPAAAAAAALLRCSCCAAVALLLRCCCAAAAAAKAAKAAARRCSCSAGAPRPGRRTLGPAWHAPLWRSTQSLSVGSLSVSAALCLGDQLRVPGVAIERLPADVLVSKFNKDCRSRFAGARLARSLLMRPFTIIRERIQLLHSAPLYYGASW
jgi:hypothetical protein